MMATHELKTPTTEFERIVSGQRPWAITYDVQDIQAGDTIDMIEISGGGSRVRDWVERDARGRFVNAWVARPAIPMMVTHVGRNIAGILSDRVVLSLAPVEDAA